MSIIPLLANGSDDLVEIFNTLDDESRAKLLNRAITLQELQKQRNEKNNKLAA